MGFLLKFHLLLEDFCIGFQIDVEEQSYFTSR